MDFFSMWVDDPIVFAFTILIVLTGIFAAYMKYNFMKNIKKQKKVKNNKQQSLKTVFSDER
ncbi:MAG: hypothetical protein WBM99_14445 [Psychromonas sp.]